MRAPLQDAPGERGDKSANHAENVCRALTACAATNTAGRHPHDDTTACLASRQMPMRQSNHGSPAGSRMCQSNLTMWTTVFSTWSKVSFRIIQLMQPRVMTGKTSAVKRIERALAGVALVGRRVMSVPNLAHAAAKR